MSKITRGSCNCGGVRWEAQGKMRPVVACHCSQCRKQTGLYYAATNVPDDKLTVHGKENITVYQSSPQATRSFCKTCGSALFWKHQDDDYTSILAGTIDGDSGLKISEHIYTDSKGDFYDIPEGSGIRN